MRINQYSVIPASVRYDRSLSPQAILLFGEINSSANAYGICDEINQYFTVALNVDVKTVNRCLNQLIDAGHIQRIFEGKTRKLRVILKTLEPPLGVEISLDEIAPKEDLFGFVQQFIGVWEKAVGTTVPKNVDYHDKIGERLKRFTKEQLFTALKNRSNYVNSSEWHKDPANRQSSVDLDLLIGSDDYVINWLNTRVKEPTFRKKIT